MEAIGEQLEEAYDAGARRTRLPRLHAVPGDAAEDEAAEEVAVEDHAAEDSAAGDVLAAAQPESPHRFQQATTNPSGLLSGTSPAATSLPGFTAAAPLDGLSAQLAAAALAAPGMLAGASYVEAAQYAAHVEELARTVECLQITSAGAVDRTRTQAIADAATAERSRRRMTGWDANGVETLNRPHDSNHPHELNETDADWPGSLSRQALTSPADDGCRNTAEFLRACLRIPIREARRRLTLAHHTLPGAALTGEPTPPVREHLAAALAPAAELLPHDGGPAMFRVEAPAVSSHSATIITATLDRLQHHASSEVLDRVEQHLTAEAATSDPDFLARLAQRWADTIDADGAEPTEEALRHTQGAFIRKPRHGLHHIEILATTEQYEYLLTVMNTATNPRTAVPGDPGPGDANTGTHLEADPGTSPGPAQQSDGVDLDRRTRPQKQLDGIVTAVKAALATNTLPTTGGNRPQIIATIDYQDLFPDARSTAATSAGAEADAGGISRTMSRPWPHTGQGVDMLALAGTAARTESRTGTGTFVFTGPVAAAALRKIACDADIIPALLGTRGEILDLGRKARLFSPAQRQAITARDQGCAFPDCTIPAPWCEAHHITYWSQGGPTSTDNGVLLCSHHHHLIHKEQWSISTAAGTPTFIPPPHIDPTRKPRQNHYFKPPPPPTKRE